MMNEREKLKELLKRTQAESLEDIVLQFLDENKDVYTTERITGLVYTLQRYLIENEKTACSAKPNVSRLIQLDGKELKQFWDKTGNNPCECGSNCYHHEMDRVTKSIYGVCNCCGEDIYIMKEEAAVEERSKGTWIPKHIYEKCNGCSGLAENEFRCKHVGECKREK